jgi:TRAP-type C4-dicarboxylate transport system substrate-binding protein
MNKLTRRALIAGGSGILCLAATQRSNAAEFSLKVANSLPATYPLNKRIGETCEKIRRETSGRVDIQLFPNGELGGDTDMRRALEAAHGALAT